jgi:predicted Zn-dependent protease with MMP-like domain
MAGCAHLIRASVVDDREFDALEDEVDRLADEFKHSGSAAEGESRTGSTERFDPVRNGGNFEQLVRSAVDELPGEFQRALEGVAIVISDGGREQNAYGLYVGHKLGHGKNFAAPESHALPDEIVIFRDTLLRDFGHDPALLRAQIIRVVRHEVGHHLGFDEGGVRRLGL